MGVFLELKDAKDTSSEVVGKKAALLAKLDTVIKLPFSLVITNEVFERFVEHNDLTDKLKLLFEKNKLVEEDVYAFKQASELIAKATFPPSLVEELKECFELMNIDTSNLQSLGSKKQAVFSLRRSVSYEDNDLVSPQVVFVREAFGDFLKAIKTCFMSLFTPTSVATRRQAKIRDFSLSIVVSRLPNVQNVLEGSFHYHHNAIEVLSYTGFIDPSKTVPRDRFIVGVDFLRILQNEITAQGLVAVFDAQNNVIVQQKYAPTGSSQSVTDQIILECARQLKKIVNSLQAKQLKGLFVLDENENMVCLDVAFLPQNEVFQPSPPQESSAKQETNTVSGEPTTQPLENQAPSTLDIQLHEESSSEATARFAKELIAFLQAHRQGKYGPSIEIVVRALENELTIASLYQAILMAKEIVDSWE